jgi:cytoskeleton protein RodZ
MKRTGEILQKAREQKGLSINEIGLSLKISSKILKAIEEGDLAQLPAKTFLRGFVQSYASYLRLDVNEVLKTFQDEMGSTRPSPLIHMPEQDSTLEGFEKGKSSEVNGPKPAASNASSGKPLNSLSKQSNSRTLTLTLLGLVLVGLIIFTKKMIDKYQKEGTVAEVQVAAPLPSASPVVSTSPSTDINTPVIDDSTSDGATTASTPISAATTPASTPKISSTPIVTATPAPTATPIATPVAKATPTPAPTATPAPAKAAVAASPTPAASPASPSNKPVEVILEALDNVEVTAASGDGKSEKLAMTSDQVHTFKSKNGLKLNVSNGGAVNVIVNGKDLGIPGNLGKPVKLSF